MMNRQVSRLAFVALALLVALIVGTTYWQTWAQAGLADRQDNEIQRVAQFTIRRGKIYARDGRLLALARYDACRQAWRPWKVLAPAGLPAEGRPVSTAEPGPSTPPG